MSGCRGSEPSGDRGSACERAPDCDTGLCLDTGDGRICTTTCGSDEDCPEDLSCEAFSLAEDADGGAGEEVRACASASP